MKVRLFKPFLPFRAVDNFIYIKLQNYSFFMEWTINKNFLPYAAKFTYGRKFIYIRTQILLRAYVNFASCAGGRGRGRLPLQPAHYAFSNLAVAAAPRGTVPGVNIAFTPEISSVRNCAEPLTPSLENDRRKVPKSPRLLAHR
jgi:hypothetical protein